MSNSYTTLGPTSYIPPLPTSPPKPTTTPTTSKVIICLHGFDSNSFEYRRLHPILSQTHNSYCCDISGWGFTSLRPGSSTASSKTSNAVKFVNDVCEMYGHEVGDVVMVGASLGATVAMEVTLELGLKRLVCLDGQCFVDGVGPTPPKFLLGLGVEVLRSRWLRRLANRLSYKNVTLGDEDAVEVGCLHTRRDGWKEGIIEFIESGGFKPLKSVSKVKSTGVKTLVLWGKDDKILPPSDRLKFRDLMGATVVDVDECGHVPHLEQPEVTAGIINKWLEDTEVEG